MEFDLTIKNYRCFSDTKPARISFRKGFTAFVGANNSGKSSLLKLPYEFRRFFSLLSSPTGNFIEALRNEDRNVALVVPDYDEVFCNTNERDIELQIEFAPPDVTNGTLDLALLLRADITIRRTDPAWLVSMQTTRAPVARSSDVAMDFRNTVLAVGGSPLVDLAPLFEAFRTLTNALYIGAFRNVLNIGTKEDYFDIRVGQALIKGWRDFKTGAVKRNNELAYRLQDDISGIFGFGRLEINPSPDDTNLQVFVDGRSYRLSELGSGLAQFFIVLANAAIKNPSYILIDEPELNLHPSLQLSFLTTLASYAREGVFFATHSIGLARASAERIYSVRRGPDGGNEVTALEETPRLSEFLGELTFTSYRELGFDKLLLVEGPSDVTTIQQFLRLFGKEHQVVLLPMGGSQLINESRGAQLEEIKRIGVDVSALVDSERSAKDGKLEPKRQAFADACQRAAIRCHVLKRRAIENYLSDRAVKKIKGEKYQSLEPYQRLKDAPHSWAKSENWRIAREMTKDELGPTDLGEFLSAI